MNMAWLCARRRDLSKLKCVHLCFLSFFCTLKEYHLIEIILYYTVLEQEMASMPSATAFEI